MSRYTTFKHWIFKDKRPLYVEGESILTGDINTLAKPDGQPACLEHSPTSWKTVTVNYGRKPKYLGLFKNMTVQLRFVKDGAKIIKDALWGVGFEANLQYGFSKLDQYSFPPKYEEYYIGDINLAKFRQDRNGIEVVTTEGGPSKYLEAHESTTYEIPVNEDPEAVTVYLDGFPFKNKIEWTIYENQVLGPLALEYELGAGIITQEGTSQGVIVQDQMYRKIIVGGNREHFLRSETKQLTATVTGSFNIKLVDTATVKLFIRKNKVEDDTVTATTDYIIVNTSTAAGLHTIEINESIPVSQQERLILMAEITGAEAYRILKGNMIVEYDVTFDPTMCRALKVSRLAEKIVEKMTDGKHSLSSQLLDSMENLVYTSGMALRNFSDQKSVIKISFNDFYKSLQRFGVMLGTKNDRIIIEAMATAFDSNIIMNLGRVANLEISLAEDMVYNTIKTGYPNQTYDNVNGLDEFNVTQQWTTPNLKVIKELDLVSPVRADMYGIELTRLTLYGQDTTDSKSDNDTFMMMVEKGATIQYYSGPFEVQGTSIINIPGTLGTLANGTVLSTDTFGDVTVTNTSYLIVGYTSITVAEVLSAGDYNEALIYDNADVYKLSRPAYDSITGLLNPSGAFNTELSPKRGLLNNSRFIASFMEDPAGLLKFTTGEKNSDLSTTIGGVTITEKEDIQVSDLGSPFFFPYYLEFDTEIPLNYKSTIEGNPYGTVQFEDENGYPFYGYMMDGDFRPATNERQKWKLLCSPLTNKNYLK